MGLGRLLTRNLQYDVTDTETGATGSYTIITDGGPGMYPAWSHGAYRGGMGIPAAARAAGLTAGLIGRAPWHAYRDRAGRVAERVMPTPPLLAAPSVENEPPLSVFRALALDRLWHGNGIALVAARGADGWPTAMHPVPAEFVQVRRVGAAENLAPFLPGEIVYLVHGRLYGARDVIHVKGPSAPGELRGMGVLENHFSLLERSRKLDEQAGAVDSSGVPTGVLKSLNPDLTAEEAEELKAAWLRAQRTRSVAVLNTATEFQPVAWNPTEVQLLEGRQYTLTEWANVFGIPLKFVGAENSSRVYSNLEQEGIDLLKFGTVGEVFEEFEQTLTMHMPRGTYAKANLDFLLESDTKSRYEAHALGIAAGFLTRDEARDLEDRPPLTPAQRAELTPPAPAPPASGSNDTPNEEEA